MRHTLHAYGTALAALGLLLPLPVVAADAVFGMTRATRSDGVTLNVLTGSYKDKARCESKHSGLVADVVIKNLPPGATLKIDSSLCDSKIPARTEFQVLRGDAKGTHIVFLTDALRVSLAHPRNLVAEERKLCKALADKVLMRYGVLAECVLPDK